MSNLTAQWLARAMEGKMEIADGEQEELGCVAQKMHLFSARRRRCSYQLTTVLFAPPPPAATPQYTTQASTNRSRACGCSRCSRCQGLSRSHRTGPEARAQRLRVAGAGIHRGARLGAHAGESIRSVPAVGGSLLLLRCPSHRRGTALSISSSWHTASQSKQTVPEGHCTDGRRGL